MKMPINKNYKSKGRCPSASDFYDHILIIARMRRPQYCITDYIVITQMRPLFYHL